MPNGMQPTNLPVAAFRYVSRTNNFSRGFLLALVCRGGALKEDRQISTAPPRNFTNSSSHCWTSRGGHKISVAADMMYPDFAGAAGALLRPSETRPIAVAVLPYPVWSASRPPFNAAGDLSCANIHAKDLRCSSRNGCSLNLRGFRAGRSSWFPRNWVPAGSGKNPVRFRLARGSLEALAATSPHGSATGAGGTTPSTPPSVSSTSSPE
mmetsp:Transcript_1187/g.3498  ORF Transcript_1187/g.3498 Transcript_1187/m.3498 type:complete len:209 (-) Transcript_1187:227-853(-)